MLNTGGSFSQLIAEYGSKHVAQQEEASKRSILDEAHVGEQETGTKAPSRGAEKEGQILMLDEERATGSVPLSTFAFFLRHMSSIFPLILLALGLVLSQGIQVAHIVWLGFWQSNQFPNVSQAAYQGVFAGIAVLFALTAFGCNVTCVAFVIRASIAICGEGVSRIMAAPTSFLDRTPVGGRWGYADIRPVALLAG